MNRAIHTLLYVAVALCTAVVSHTGFAAETTTRTLVAGIGLNADTPQGRGMLKFAEIVQARSKGRIKVEVHTSGKLGDDLKMIAALQAGKQDITCPDSSTLSKMVRAFSVINYPFTFLNEDEADYILDGEWGRRALAQLPSHKLFGLAYWENGFRHLTNSKQPIPNLRDTNGIRVRVMQNQMLIDSFQHMGFQAVPMPFPQVYAALKDKQVDAQENPLPTILSSKFYEVQPYLTLSRHVYSAFVLLMAQSTWASFNEADQQLLLQSATEARDFERKLNREVTAAALDQLRAKGMQVSVIDVKEAELIRRKLRYVLDKYNKEIDEKVVIDMYVALSQLRAQKAIAGQGSFSKAP